MQVTFITGLLTQPSILLIFKNSAKQKMKMYAEVHGVSVKSNADDIRVDDSGNQIFIRVDTAKEHIRWIAVLKSAITKCMYTTSTILLNFTIRAWLYILL